MPKQILVSYSTISEVDRFLCEFEPVPQRDDRVVVETARGPQIGTVLSPVRDSESPPQLSVIRAATSDDLEQHQQHHSECESEYFEWTKRIEEWDLDLELIDMEWTIDHTKVILYVLSDRGPDCTKLALQAAAAGLGVIEVQPVNAEGLAPIASQGGGCGCSSGGGGCSTKKK